MALTREQLSNFGKAVAYLPANALTGLSSLLLGSTVTKSDGSPKIVKGQVLVTPGLLGYLAEGIKAVGRSATDFLKAHKTAITVAAWASLAVAGGLALTLALWPAALATVAGFTIAGLSIAAIAGPSAIAQIGLAAGLAAAATSVATYVGAAVGNFVSWVASCCKEMRAKHKNASLLSSHPETDASTTQKLGVDTGSQYKSNPYASSKLNTDMGQGTKKEKGTVVPFSQQSDVHYDSPIATPKKETEKGTGAPVVTDEQQKQYTV
ncbi:transmembrane protein [Legionella steigerwaltii]|uniref:Transmembrane protein n=1 Tax=Legionella steigerwaltii TaxID=460 RepID=A0A378L466_9GAMM|nr:hypothetical protein [Legionella steigerwaltii]KTD77095.1 transmembrane protein [Legionella steigerwaltii]STY21586.1 transmembrane protein [Legionella steigerwaltii]